MHMKKRIRVKKIYIYNNFIIITKSYNKKKNDEKLNKKYRIARKVDKSLEGKGGW